MTVHNKLTRITNGTTAAGGEDTDMADWMRMCDDFYKAADRTHLGTTEDTLTAQHQEFLDSLEELDLPFIVTINGKNGLGRGRVNHMQSSGLRPC